MIVENRLIMFVIYDHPSDYPDEFVCRRCIPTAAAVLVDSELFARGKTLEEVRKQIPAGQTRLEIDPSDDPVIVEIWL